MKNRQSIKANSLKINKLTSSELLNIKGGTGVVAAVGNIDNDTSLDTFYTLTPGNVMTAGTPFHATSDLGD